MIQFTIIIYLHKIKFHEKIRQFKLLKDYLRLSPNLASTSTTATRSFLLKLNFGAGLQATALASRTIPTNLQKFKFYNEIVIY